jgi:hypothetical protein
MRPWRPLELIRQMLQLIGSKPLLLGNHLHLGEFEKLWNV